MLVCLKTEKEIVCDDEFYDVLYTDEDRPQEEIIKNGIKQCKSKYVLLTDGNFEILNVKPLIEAADNAAEDVLSFTGGRLYKASVLKGLGGKEIGDRFLTEFFAAIASKSVKTFEIEPFKLNNEPFCYFDGLDGQLLFVTEAFTKCKAKLNKDVFTLVFDMLCERLVLFYLSAILAVKGKKMKVGSLLNFDLQLKKNIVLYLAVQKRFTAASLIKLREKKFAVSFFTAKKLKKALNKKK